MKQDDITKVPGWIEPMTLRFSQYLDPEGFNMLQTNPFSQSVVLTHLKSGSVSTCSEQLTWKAGTMHTFRQSLHVDIHDVGLNCSQEK